MSLSRLLLPALAAACLMSSGAFADPPSPPPQGDHGPGPGGPGGPGGPMGFLTPEEHIMLFADMLAATKSLSEDQRHAYMRTRFESIRAMSDAARKSFAADLKVRWDALPLDQKAELKKQIEAMRKKGPPPGGQGGPGSGPGPQR
jgi:hypothetical protein